MHTYLQTIPNDFGNNTATKLEVNGVAAMQLAKAIDPHCINMLILAFHNVQNNLDPVFAPTLITSNYWD